MPFCRVSKAMLFTNLSIISVKWPTLYALICGDSVKFLAHFDYFDILILMILYHRPSVGMYVTCMCVSEGVRCFQSRSRATELSPRGIPTS